MTTVQTTTITVYIPEGDVAPYTLATEHDMEDQFEEMLSETYDTVSICGYDYDAGTALKRLDPIAFRQEFLNYLDSYTELVMPLDVFLSDDDDARDEWIDSQL